MRRIQTFKDYVNEQEKSTEADILGGMNPGEMAKGMLAMGLQNLGMGMKTDYSSIAETPETKAGKAYTGCGSAPYPFKPSEATNQDLINLFKDPKGAFAKDVKYSEIHKLLEDPNNKKIFLVGVRESLSVKLKEGDKFVDKMIIVDPNAPNDKVASYQITTSPSVAYYGDVKRTMNKDGVAIMQPGVTKYTIGTHRKGTPTQHEALVQAGDMAIERFKVGSTELDKYNPGNPDKGSEYGINIHRSSQELGVCVGPWSAGCQVFANGTDFTNFMSKMKGATANGNSFLYALVENDVLAGKSEEEITAANDKKGAESTASEVDSSQFEDVGSQIRTELDKTNSDEDKLIQIYNGIATDAKAASAFAKWYQSTYNVNVIEDLDRALDKSELEKLNHK